METVKRAWQGGPLRNFSTAPKANWSRHDEDRLFWGPYVCDHCQRSVNGIYEPKPGIGDGRKWLCSECRNALRPKEARPEGFTR